MGILRTITIEAGSTILMHRRAHPVILWEDLPAVVLKGRITPIGMAKLWDNEIPVVQHIYLKDTASHANIYVMLTYHKIALFQRFYERVTSRTIHPFPSVVRYDRHIYHLGYNTRAIGISFPDDPVDLDTNEESRDKFRVMFCNVMNDTIRKMIYDVFADFLTANNVAAIILLDREGYHLVIHLREEFALPGPMKLFITSTNRGAYSLSLHRVGVAHWIYADKIHNTYTRDRNTVVKSLLNHMHTLFPTHLVPCHYSDIVIYH